MSGTRNPAAVSLRSFAARDPRPGYLLRHRAPDAVLDNTQRDLGTRMALPVLVLAYRFTREGLKALGQAEGIISKEMPEVLFVCVHNAGRSQMAAGLVKLRSGGRIHVRSAGSAPGEVINPAVVEAMEELGVDLSEEFPKPLTDEVVRAADVVITMGCGDACPIFPGKRYEDWVLDDPAGQDIETVRRIRDELDTRVTALTSELLATNS